MKTMEKLVTLAMPEHDISQGVEKPFAGESHFLWENYSIFLSGKEFSQISQISRNSQFFTR
jgi:hypothetical protein